jgi:hypothetical protein
VVALLPQAFLMCFDAACPPPEAAALGRGQVWTRPHMPGFLMQMLGQQMPGFLMQMLGLHMPGFQMQMLGLQMPGFQMLVWQMPGLQMLGLQMPGM